MSRRRDQRYPLNQPPDGMVVEPALPSKDPMTPSQRSVNNSLATADEENLPPVTDAQGNPVPLDEFSPPADAMVDPTPAEVRRATMSVPSKGVHFNFEPFQQIAQLHAAGQTDEARNIYNSLDPQSRYVYENIKNMKKVPASEAARLADEFRQKQDRLSMPQNQLAAEKVSEKKTAKLNERRDAMRTAQTMLEAADRIDRAIDAGLVGPWKDVEQKFDGSGLPFSDPDQFAERKALEVQTKRSVIDVLPAFKGPLSDSDRRFFTEMFPEIKEPTGVWKDYSKQLREKFRPIAEGNFELPSEQEQRPAQGAAATAAPARNTFVYDGATYERLPDGTARLIE
jgi:hypothetical protein